MTSPRHAPVVGTSLATGFAVGHEASTSHSGITPVWLFRLRATLWSGKREPAACSTPATYTGSQITNPDREIDAATDHPRAFAEAILDCTPTISKSDKRLSIEFDEPEQAADAFNLLWAAIKSEAGQHGGRVMPRPIQDLMNELDDAYESAKHAWQRHVDGHCLECAKSPFACQVQMELHESWNTAWCGARTVFLSMTESEREQWRESKDKSCRPAPGEPAPASTEKEG